MASGLGGLIGVGRTQKQQALSGLGRKARDPHLGLSVEKWLSRAEYQRRSFQPALTAFELSPERPCSDAGS